MQCCGAQGPDEYINYNRSFSSTCCPQHVLNCNYDTSNKEGCYDKIADFVKFEMKLTAWTCLLLIPIQVMITICYLDYF